MLNLVNRKQERGHFGVNAVNLSWLERRAWTLMLTHQPDVLPQMHERSQEEKIWMIDGWSRHLDMKLKGKNEKSNKRWRDMILEQLFEITGWAVFIDKKLITETKRILAWAQCQSQSGRFEKGSPGWLGWAAVCLLNQPGRSGAAVSMPTTGWAGLRCSTCPQHLPGCSCHQNWEATTPTDKKKKQTRGREVKTCGQTGNEKQQIKCNTLAILPRQSHVPFTKKVVTVWHQIFRGKVSIINQTVAASLALFTAGAMNVHIMANLNMIKAEPVWCWSRLPWCACVCNYIIMKTLTPLNPPPGSRQWANPGTQIVYNYW